MKPPIQNISAAALVLAACFAANSALGQPARSARVSDCVWAAIPSSTRQALTAAAPSMQAVNEVGEQLVGEKEGMAMLDACGLPHVDQNVRLSIYSLIAKALELGSAAQLKAKYAVDDGDLAIGWDHLPAATRTALAAMFSPPIRLTESDNAAIDSMAHLLKVSGDDARLLVFTYASGRATLETIDGPPAAP